MKELSELLEGIEVEDDEFIPKSKIRTKIKELEEIYNNTDTLEIDKRLMINAEIIVLKELLNKE